MNGHDPEVDPSIENGFNVDDPEADASAENGHDEDVDP